MERSKIEAIVQREQDCVQADVLDISNEAKIVIARRQIARAIEFAVRYGGTDEMHHLRWVVDQMVRTLAGDNYNAVVEAAKNGEDGPDTYEWNVGIAP